MGPLSTDPWGVQVLVGELVGARLIAHAGSLLNLAKQPASTVQILGAEKALFRALKTKHEVRAVHHSCLSTQRSFIASNVPTKCHGGCTAC